ncbi:hypothetical protein ACVWYH_007343 [Bradyrhizobium sp. GM24.11]
MRSENKRRSVQLLVLTCAGSPYGHGIKPCVRRRKYGIELPIPEPKSQIRFTSRPVRSTISRSALILYSAKYSGPSPVAATPNSALSLSAIQVSERRRPARWLRTRAVVTS